MAQNYNVTIKRYNGTDWDVFYPRTTASNIIGTIQANQISDLDASKITSGVFDVNRIPNLSASKITSGTFNVNRIPDLDASKITSGVLYPERIPNLSASKIASGTFDVNRIPDLPASKITSGTIDAARLPAIALTNVMTYSNWDMFAGLYSNDMTMFQEGDVIIITGSDRKGTYIHNGGTSGDAEQDFTLMELPDSVVTSINGKKGQVTLTYTDIGGLTSGSYIKTDIIPDLPISKITNLQSNLNDLNSKINDKQREIRHIVTPAIPTNGEFWEEGDIIFHNYD